MSETRLTHNISRVNPNPERMVSVVIPAYNERATIEEILVRVQAVNLPKEIIVVDDASTDGTRELLAEVGLRSGGAPGELLLPRSGARLSTHNIRVFFQEKNCGKGAALRRGFEEARGQIVVIQDADLEYDPQDLQRLIEPIDRGEADVVYGSRFLGGGPHRVHLFWHYVGNRLLTLMSDMVTDLNLSDVWTCYKAFKREALEGLHSRKIGLDSSRRLPSRLPRINGVSTRSRYHTTGARIPKGKR